MSSNTKPIAVIIISGPSGSGKTSITKEILERLRDKIMFSVSYTTRRKRKGEKDGREYYFISKGEFQQMIEKDEFLEWNSIYGEFYGTPKKNLDKAIMSGKILLMEIDVDGAKKVREKCREMGIQVCSIFISPPKIETLRERLKKRSDTCDIEERMKRVEKESKQSKEFDFVVVNDNLKMAQDYTENIIRKFIE